MMALCGFSSSRRQSGLVLMPMAGFQGDRSMQSFETEILNWHNNAAATFYWPKQVTRLGPEEEWDSKHYKVAWQQAWVVCSLNVNSAFYFLIFLSNSIRKTTC